MKVSLHVLGMALLGLVALAPFAALVEWRVGQPLEPVVAERASAGATARGAPLAVLASGLEASLATATRELYDNRSAAVHALDAAMRAAEAGSRSGGGMFQHVHERVVNARHELQNGDVAAARSSLMQASGRLRDIGIREAAEAPYALAAYSGATLIDRHGIRIGEVSGVAQRGGRTLVGLATSGVRDAAGFIDLGRTTFWVPPEVLVFGETKTLGHTLVSWPYAQRR